MPYCILALNCDFLRNFSNLFTVIWMLCYEFTWGQKMVCVRQLSGILKHIYAVNVMNLPKSDPSVLHLWSQFPQWPGTGTLLESTLVGHHGCLRLIPEIQFVTSSPLWMKGKTQGFSSTVLHSSFKDVMHCS